MTISLTAEGKTYSLSPAHKYLIGTGSSDYDIPLSAAIPPGALAEIRCRPHWMIRVVRDDAVVRAEGATVSGHYVHLPTYLGDEVVTVTVTAANVSVSLRLGRAAPSAGTDQTVDTPHIDTLHIDTPYIDVAPPVRAGTSVSLDTGTGGEPPPPSPPPPSPPPADRPLVIGSGRSADIVVEGTDVAAEHATLHRRGREYRLRDHGHGGGTFVGGKPVLWARLSPGDTFTIGDVRFSVLPDGGLARSRLGPPDLWVEGLSASIGPRRLLSDVSFSVPASSLFAVVGPSGAGKSTLFRTLLGEVRSSQGMVIFRGLDLRTHAAQIRHMLGFVPQQDHLHDGLTARQALWYAGLFRLPLDWTPQRRNTRIEEICRRLAITGNLDQPLHTLSGGQRKRVSIALEVLPQPSLLLLDEPTSGLDADLAREVMLMLKDLARQEACTVMVITHATEDLDVADHVLALASGGFGAYSGPPEELLGSLGATGYADGMASLRRGVVSHAGRAAATRTSPPDPISTDKQRGIGRMRRNHPELLGQLRILVRRQLALIGARRAAALGPVLVALVGAALAAAVTGSDGLGGPSAAQALSLLTTLCVVGGQALVYGDLVAEYHVIRREHRTGTMPAAVVLAKSLVFGAIAVMQAALVTAVYLTFRPGPATHLVAGPEIELFIGLAATGLAAMALGLLISAHARSLERAISAATLAVVVQVGLNGVAFPLAGRPWVAAFAYPLPARWGLASVASSLDLRQVAPQVADDPMWAHTTSQWLINLAALACLSTTFVLLAWRRLDHRLRAQER
jgi:ABC transport system ATP-binding/permease protein